MYTSIVHPHTVPHSVLLLSLSGEVFVEAENNEKKGKLIEKGN